MKNFFINLFGQFALQLINITIPVVTIPLLISAVDLESYGIMAMGQALANIVFIIASFGFGFRGTKDIAELPNSLEQSRYVLIAIYLQTLLFVVTASVAGILIILLGYDKLFLILVIFLIGSFGNIFSINWVYNGNQQSHILSIVTVPVRLLAVLSIYILSFYTNNIVSFTVLLSMQNCIIGAVLFAMYLSRTHSFLSKVTFLELKEMFLLNISSFSLRALPLVYTTSSTFFIGILLGPQSAGLYSAAEKIKNLITIINTPIINAVLPFITKKLAFEGRMVFDRYFVNILIITTVSTFVFSWLAFLLKNEISAFFFGNIRRDFINYLSIILIMPVLISVSNTIMTHYLLPLNRNFYSFLALLLGVIIFLLGLPIIIITNDDKIFLWLVVFVELVICSCFVYLAIKVKGE